MKKSVFSRLSLLLCGLIAASTLSVFGQTHLVISQVYGGGGNTGATYNADFVELYNPTSSNLSTSGFSIQYASATGSTGFGQPQALPTASIPPGRYYLIQLTAPTAIGVSLPTPDATFTSPNMGTAAGKVALVNLTTALSGDTTCALIQADTRIIDFVGFGTTANCYQGSGPTPAPSVTASVVRGGLSGNNSTDFTVLSPPNPRNSAAGTPTGTISATGSASPATVIAGNSTTLSVTVTPGTSPASTGITVTGDLRLIGGSQTQAFTSGSNNTFTFNATVTTTSSGNIALPISITDAQTRTASATISLIVNQPVASVAIDVIQGTKSKTAVALSPYAGQSVTTTGIVTAVIPAAVFIQTPDGQTDGNPLTPEGIQVYYGTGKVPSGVAVGANITVTGPVATYPALSTATVQGSSTPATEINVPVSTVINSTNNPLPSPVILTTADLTPGGGLFQLTPYEGMRVSIASMTTTSGTEGTLVENTETITSTGAFYAVIGDTPRPFRSPGIDIRDLAVQNRPANVANFDDNPERIYIDSDLAGGTGIEVSTGAVLKNVTGVLDFTFTADQYYDPSRLILDPDSLYPRNTTNITPGMTVQPVPAKAANEFTVASYNIERFFNTNAADDIYKTSTLATATPTHPDLTQSAYTRRLQKVSLAVRNVLNSPDVVTIEEVENQSVASDIANQINNDAGIPGLYTGLSTDNSTYYTQDGTGISVGFLVKNTVSNLGFSQYGYGETTPSGSTLNDRPWLVLSAGIKRAGAKDYPVTVIVNHLKSLINVNSTTSNTTRVKKELQAEDIAKYIQGLQAAGKHVISGGDFNAFEFSDGYTDTLATYTNVGVLPSDQVVQPGVAGLVTPPLVNLALNLPTAQRWSYQESGSAQILDHMVVTPELASAGAHLAYAHMNADFPESATNNPNIPDRNSDHDAAVGYFILPTPVLSATLTPPSADFGTVAMNEVSAGQGFTLTNTGEAAISITSIAASGDFTASNTCGSSLAINSSCSINVVFAPTAGGARTGTLTVVTGGATYTSTLTGTGTAVTAVGTTTSLAVTPASPVNAGTTVTLTASVLAGASPAIAGTVSFYDGTALVGSAQVSVSGTAILKLVPGVGTHTYQAQLQTSIGLLPSSSTQQSLVVNGTGNYATTVLLSYALTGNNTYSATSTINFYGQSFPTGSLTFTDTTSGQSGSTAIGALTQTLSPATSYTTGAASTGSLISATGDFNNDGIPDIAVTNLVDSTVTVLLGKGGIAGAYQTQVSYPVGRAPYGVATGDFNKDGNADIAVTNLVDGTVSILLGNGTGTFSAQTAYPTGSTGTQGATTFPEPYALLVADINKDGNTDIVTTNTTEGSVSVLLGTGTGAFAAPVTTTVGGEPFTSVAADFNNDGNTDLLVIDAIGSKAVSLVGSGNGSFTVPTTPSYPTGLTPYSAAVGDFNNDGYQDVVVSNLGNPNQPPTTGSVTVLLNSAGNGFTTATYATGVEPTSVAVFDFDGDGKLDIAVSNLADNTVGILTGTGTGTFNTQTAFPSIASPYALSVADLNGDGKKDLVVTGFGGNSVGVQLGTQTAVITFGGLSQGNSADTASSTYTSGASDAYATSTSNTITVPSNGLPSDRKVSTKKVATPTKTR